MKHVVPFFGNPAESPPPPKAFVSFFGVILVIFGVLLCVLAFIRFKAVEKQIEDNTYQPSILLNVMLTLSVLLIGIFLMIYLKHSI